MQLQFGFTIFRAPLTAFEADSYFKSVHVIKYAITIVALPYFLKILILNKSKNVQDFEI